MANEIITTLHPEQDPDTNLYPNIKKENIPNRSIDENKLDLNYINKINDRFNNVNNRIDDMSDGSPRYVNTSSNILSLTTNQGLAVSTDTGHWYYWDGTKYVDGGLYQATGIADGSITNSKLSTSLSNMLLKTQFYVDKYNYTFRLPSINSLIESCVYYIIDLTISITGLPSEVSGIGILTHYFLSYDNTADVYMQVLDCLSINKRYTRQKIYSPSSSDPSDWSEWVEITSPETILITWLNDDQYREYVTDWNDIKENKQYYIASQKVWNGITNSPTDIFNEGVFISYKNYYSSTAYEVTQLIISNGRVWQRSLKHITEDVWTSWQTPNIRSKITIGENGDYTSFFEGMKQAWLLGNCDVYIEGGEYDLSSEVASMSAQYGAGIPIGKNNTYNFSSNSKIICNYTGGNETTMTNFALFMCYDSNFIMNNLTAEVSNLRYIFHDECGGQVTTKQYEHIYESCNLKIDNTDIIESLGFFHCIGGGLGVNGLIKINNCIFNSVAVKSDNKSDVQYHGNWDSSQTSGKSNIFVTNSYFEHTFSISDPNTETQKKLLIFTNNSCATDINYRNTSDAYWDVKKWNNNIRL